MYYLIESKNQLDYLIDKAEGNCYMRVITLNDKMHPALTSISLIYYKPFNDKAYMLCLDHPDTLNQLDINAVKTLLSKHELIFTIDRKAVLYHLPLELPVIDLNFIKLEKDNQIYDISDVTTKTHDKIYRELGRNVDVNKLIPVQKHFEKEDLLLQKFLVYLLHGGWEKDWSDGTWDRVRWYNREYVNRMWEIERTGIKINNDKFFKHFEPLEEIYSIKDDRIFTSYNLYNLTGRPTNSFNNINFSALTKTSRVSFIPSNGYLVEYDYDGFHPRLIGSLINVKFEKSVHETIAEWYNEPDIQEAKKITFRQLYGGIEDKYLTIPFFRYANETVRQLWKKWETERKIELAGGRTLHYTNQMNPSKLFNYYIQSLETYENINRLDDILEALKNNKTKLIHYTYDSFLFDVDVNDNVNVVSLIEYSLTKNYPVKKVYGKNYKEMNRF